jgi:RimJ/RimL family protein N-acetyltransferase
VGAWPTLVTERLVMRPFREEDLDAYTAMLRSEPVRRALHLPDTVSREDAWQQMAAFSGQWHLRNHGPFALEERATGRFVGRAGPHRPERADWPGIEIGWTLDPSVWGRGYATEAGGAAIDWVFAHHNVDVLYSMILAENSASQAVARRLGFRPGTTKVWSFFTDAPHTAWELPRAVWEVRPAQVET